MTELRGKISTHENYLIDLAQKQQELKKIKEDKSKELVIFYRSLNQKLE